MVMTLLSQFSCFKKLTIPGCFLEPIFTLFGCNFPTDMLEHFVFFLSFAHFLIIKGLKEQHSLGGQGAKELHPP